MRGYRCAIVVLVVALLSCCTVSVVEGTVRASSPTLRALHGAGGLAGTPTQSAHEVLEQQATLLQDTEAALSTCRSQFETYAQQATDAVNQCNGNIEFLNQQAVALDTALKACQSTPNLRQQQTPQPCPSPSPPEARTVEKVVEVPAGGTPWLVIGIPSVPRRNDVDYMSATLDFILEQLPADPNHPWFGKVKIVVMNNGKGKPHKVFDDNKRRLDPAVHPKGSYVLFDVNPNRPRSASRHSNNPNVPSAKVQQQSADVIHLVRAAAPLGSYYMFMEDDFRLCPRGLVAIQSLMEKATLHFNNWIVLRISFGLNGAILRSEDALAYAEYLNKHIERRPPDHMLVEWFAGERPESKAYVGDRRHIAFRYNLLEHLGDISSLRTAKTPVYAACYEQLLEPVLFQVEAFKPAECGHQDIWPCPAQGDPRAGPVIPWDKVGRQIERIKELPLPKRYN